jgi:hypothetical protein
MSLYVVFDTDVERGNKGGWQWHVGEKSPFTNTAEILHIVEVQADGDELEHIYNKAIGVRSAYNARVVRWFGDDAQFIVANCLK